MTYLVDHKFIIFVTCNMFVANSLVACYFVANTSIACIMFVTNTFVACIMFIVNYISHYYVCAIITFVVIYICRGNLKLNSRL